MATGKIEQVIGPQNYTRFQNGIAICIGRFSASVEANSNTQFTIDLPGGGFIEAPVGFANCESTMPSIRSALVKPSGLTRIIVTVENSDYAVTFPVHWLAIGRWK